MLDVSEVVVVVVMVYVCVIRSAKRDHLDTAIFSPKHCKQASFVKLHKQSSLND